MNRGQFEVMCALHGRVENILLGSRVQYRETLFYRRTAWNSNPDAFAPTRKAAIIHTLYQYFAEAVKVYGGQQYFHNRGCFCMTMCPSSTSFISTNEPNKSQSIWYFLVTNCRFRIVFFSNKWRLECVVYSQAYDAVPFFPDVDLSVRVLGFWFVWLFTVPSLRARKPGEAEKAALNVAFLATPLISFAMPFITKASLSTVLHVLDVRA